MDEVANTDGRAFAGCRLPGHRLALDQRSSFAHPGHVDQQLAVAQLHARRPVVAPANVARVSARSDNVSPFQNALAADVEQVYAGIESLVDDVSISGDVGMPVRRIVPDEVVDNAGQLLPANHPRIRIGPLKAQAQ